MGLFVREFINMHYKIGIISNNIGLCIDNSVIISQLLRQKYPLKRA